MLLIISYLNLYTILYKNLKCQKDTLYMRKNLKRLIEQEVYDAIDEIADEFKFGEDLRAKKEYRKMIAPILVKRALQEVLK